MAALAALITLLAIYGLYSRQRGESEAANSPSAPGGLFQEGQARGTSLTAVGRANGLAQPCTAWLLDTGGQADDAAHAVTTARCVGVADSASVLSEQPTPGAEVQFNTFASLTSAARVEPVVAPVEQVVWASAVDTDLAILRLGRTYGDLEAAGVRPIAVADPPADRAILVASVPVEGIDVAEQHLRGGRCSLGESTAVGESVWLWPALSASDCDGILGGSIGAPAFNPAGQAVGIVTTTTIAAPEGPDCSAGRPCEVSDGSVTVKADTTYLLGVADLARCFSDGRLDLAGSCRLPDADSAVPARALSPAGRPGGTLPVAVDVTDPADLEAKSGPIGRVECADPDDWDAAEVGPDGSVEVPLPDRAGPALVCVGSASRSTAILVQVDGTPPDAGAIELEQTEVAGGISVSPIPDPPELVSFEWVSGPEGTIDCATAEGYAPYPGSPAVIPAADLPSTVCVIGIDEAGNRSAPASITVG